VLTPDDRLATLKAVRDDLARFGEKCLKVRTKAGKVEPFIMNASQLALHARLEAQKAEHGFVRVLVLKGRQQGISTYTGARFYHKASLRKGRNVYILSHEQSASDTLFGMVDRYQRNNPLAPHVGTSNAKELVFDKLDSSYAVATAGTKAGGRGKATSLLHGSEVAFWANAPDHFAASVQGVPLEDDTEIILESTSAGAGGEFYERYLDAEAGRGDYIAVFLPWWLAPEYSRPPPSDFELSNDADDGELSEVEYASMFGLNLGQMCWRRNKIHELRDPLLFQREYPATPAEAWTAPVGHEPFIRSIDVMRARKRRRDAYGPLILGVDPASNGGDRFSVAARRGMKVSWVKYRNKINVLEGALWIKTLIDELNPARVNIDAGNIGAAIITLVKAYGPKYAKVVRSVNFGETSQAKVARPKVAGPKNRRAEMWQRMNDWLVDPAGADLPDDDSLQTDMSAPRLKPQVNNDFLLESKVDMKARKVRSPDLADSVALTFASNEHFDRFQASDDTNVNYGDPDAHQNLTPAPAPGYVPPPINGGGGWMG
jgi:hypothetical protein